MDTKLELRFIHVENLLSFHVAFHVCPVEVGGESGPKLSSSPGSGVLLSLELDSEEVFIRKNEDFNGPKLFLLFSASPFKTQA